MARLPRIGALIALGAAGVALLVLLLSKEPGPEPLLELQEDARTETSEERPLTSRPRPGGVYAGIVVDADGKPLRGAHVLLVAYGSGATSATDTSGDFEVPHVGAYEVGGEVVTGPDGRFRIAADAQSHITRVLAYAKGYFLEVIEVKAPSEDLKIVLALGGRVLGTVVDHVTGDPVAGAVVDVFLQQRVSPVPETPEGVAYPVIKREQFDTSWLATLGRFIPKVLGPRVYGLPYEGTDTLRLRTDANGHFVIGPLGNKVQLEFVITHSRYKWIDFDTLKGDKEGGQTPNRTVVEPGETIEREFRLRKGDFVAGQVVDDQGKGIGDVSVMVQSIYAVYKHWWYRHKYRTSRTDRDGHFRVEGLAGGAQQIQLNHPSFGKKYETAEAGTDNLVIVAERLGALHGTVEGIPRGKAGRPITVVIRAEGDVTKVARQRREKTRLKSDNTFIVERIEPGSYRTWVSLAREASLPIEVTIEPYGVAKIVYELGGGGTVQVRAVDRHGGLVEPVSARLIAVRDGKEVALGSAVSREGVLEVDGLAPGRYRLRIQAASHVPVTTETFEIVAERVAILPPVTLREWGFLQFSAPVDEGGRPARIPTGEELIIEFRRGKKPFRRLRNAGVNVPVAPGTVAIRARAGDLRYEGTVEVEDGKTSPVQIVLQLPR